MSGIIRVKKKANPYVCIDKTPLEDERLSWKARGILAFLLSKPDNWQISIANLENSSNRDGRKAVQSAIKELENNGYVVRHRLQNEKGHFVGWETYIFETPEDAIEQGFSPTDRKPAIGENATMLQDTTDRPLFRRRTNRPTEKGTLIINELVINENSNNSLSSFLSHKPEAEPEAEQREREFLKPKPKPKAAELTREESPDPISNLPEPEREEFLKFGESRAKALPQTPVMIKSWIAANFTELYDDFYKSPERRQAKKKAAVETYDWRSDPRFDVWIFESFNRDWEWINECESEREQRNNFSQWARQTNAYEGVCY